MSDATYRAWRDAEEHNEELRKRIIALEVERDAARAERDEARRERDAANKRTELIQQRFDGAIAQAIASYDVAAAQVTALKAVCRQEADAVDDVASEFGHDTPIGDKLYMASDRLRKAGEA